MLQQIYGTVLLRLTTYSLMFLVWFLRQILSLVFLLLSATDNTNMRTEDFSYLANTLGFSRINVYYTSGREMQFKFSSGNNFRTIVMDFNLNELNQTSIPSKRPHESLQSPPEVEKEGLGKGRRGSRNIMPDNDRSQHSQQGLVNRHKRHASKKQTDDESDFVNIPNPEKENYEENNDEQKNVIGKLNVTEEQKAEALRKWNELPSQLEREEVHYNNNTVPKGPMHISVTTNVSTTDEDDD